MNVCASCSRPPAPPSTSLFPDRLPSHASLQRWAKWWLCCCALRRGPARCSLRRMSSWTIPRCSTECCRRTSECWAGPMCPTISAPGQRPAAGLTAAPALLTLGRRGGAHGCRPSSMLCPAAWGGRGQPVNNPSCCSWYLRCRSIDMCLSAAAELPCRFSAQYREYKYLIAYRPPTPPGGMLQAASEDDPGSAAAATAAAGAGQGAAAAAAAAGKQGAAEAAPGGGKPAVGHGSAAPSREPRWARRWMWGGCRRLLLSSLGSTTSATSARCALLGTA